MWWDTALRLGEAFDEVIETALRSARAVVVLWSPRSVASRWVRAEATLADRCKTLVPVTIESCERPIIFELTQTADLSHWHGATDDPAWRAFLDDVRRMVGSEAPATAAPVAAPEPPPATPGKRGEAPSLAVLPFTNRSGLAEDEVFAFGMVEDLIDALSRGIHARVISSSSTARFCNGPLPDVEALGRQLAVSYLLEGNVRRSGGDLRVTAQLVEAASGAIVWTQKFDRPLADLAALQEELIVELAAHLGTQFFRLGMERALRKPGDLTAWECCMRASAAIRQMNSETVGRAIEEAKRAVAIAPDYGLAHAVLADVSALAYQFLSPDNPDEVRRIRHHIDRALACDGENAVVLGLVADALVYTNHPAEALRRARRALEINPGYGYAHFIAGVASSMRRQTAAALAHFADFRRIEPQSPYQHYAYLWEAGTYIRLGDPAAAEAAYDCSLTLNPAAAYAYCQKALFMSQLGRASEAQALMIETRRRESTATLALWELRMSRWYPSGRVLNQLLSHLRVVWAETEGAA